jgi:predicted ATPase
MLNNLTVKNLTVFPEIRLQFSQNLNVIVGENGTGKTHLLKILYSALATSGEEGRKSPNGTPTKTLLQTRLADKLIHVFRPDYLGRLTRGEQGRERCDIKLHFQDSRFNFAFSPSLRTESGFLINS